MSMPSLTATGRYHGRRWRDHLATALAIGAAGFGLTWLVLILLVLVVKGVGGLSLAVFTEMTPPPGSAGGLLNPTDESSAVTSFMLIDAGNPSTMLRSSGQS